MTEESAAQVRDLMAKGFAGTVFLTTDDCAAAYEDLRHSSEILESTFNSMAEGVLVIEPDGKIALSNETVTHFLGSHPGKTFAGKTYCESTTVRGGWTRVDCKPLRDSRQ